MSDAPLLIYHHLPRTGGTSLSAVVRDNYAPGEIVTLHHEFGRARRESAAAGKELSRDRWHREWYESLSDVERERLKCVAGHTANRLVPFLHRPFRVFCLLRHPVDRVCSLYRWISARAGSQAVLQRRGGFPAAEAIHRYGWSLADIYRELGGETPSGSSLHRQFSRFFNGQTRSILEPWHGRARLEQGTGLVRQDAALRDEALEILARHYVVGLQERFGDSLERFAASFGWSCLSIPRLNVSRVEGDEGPDAETRALILAHNQLDAELHTAFAEEAVT